MIKTHLSLVLVDGFLQSGNSENLKNWKFGHNPYFSRWFSAIRQNTKKLYRSDKVTILILVDGFLQFPAVLKLFHWL